MQKTKYTISLSIKKQDTVLGKYVPLPVVSRLLKEYAIKNGIHVEQISNLLYNEIILGKQPVINVGNDRCFCLDETHAKNSYKKYKINKRLEIIFILEE